MSSNVIAWADDGPEYLKLDTFGDDVHCAELRQLAYDWHGGQWSPLYAFASSGAITEGLASEADRCASQAETLEAADDYEPSEDRSFPDSLMLRTIATLARQAGDES